MNLCPLCHKSVTQKMSGNQDYRTGFVLTHLACAAKAWDNEKKGQNQKGNTKMIIDFKDDPEEEVPAEPETPTEPTPEPDDDGIEDPAGTPA